MPPTARCLVAFFLGRIFLEKTIRRRGFVSMKIAFSADWASELPIVFTRIRFQIRFFFFLLPFLFALYYSSSTGQLRVVRFWKSSLLKQTFKLFSIGEPETVIICGKLLREPNAA